MKITDALLGEHGVLYALFTHLEQTTPTTSPLERVHDQAALLAAGLATHARIEDELLFCALEPHIGRMGPLMVMREEHEEIEGALAGLPAIQDLEEARRTLLHAVQVAREHFTKEEQVLYPMARQCLDADVLTRLGGQWADQRAVTV